MERVKKSMEKLDKKCPIPKITQMTHLKAQKYIEDHNNPAVRIDLPHLKHFLRPSSTTETTNEDPLRPLEFALKHDRVERRCARVRSEWLPDLNLIRVTKITGACAQFGFQNRDGKFLYPEEALHLLETNRIEIFYEEIPLSIQECYQMFLKSPECSLQKYRVFKNMTLHGYHLTKTLKEENGNASKEEPPEKKRKYESSDPENSYKNSKINEVFQKLKENGPQEYEIEPPTVEPDYFVYLPTNSTKLSYDFKLFMSDKPFEEDLCFNQLADKAVFCFCSDDKVAFFKIAQIHLPDLTR